MKIPFSVVALGLFLSLGMAGSLPGQNLLSNSGFEKGSDDWRMFVARGSEHAGCEFNVVAGGAHAGKIAATLKSTNPARFGICPVRPPITVKAGERYRLSAWVKAGDDFQVEPGTAGVVIRATLFQAPWVDAKDGHVFISLNGVSQPDAVHLSAGQSVPKEWTKLEGVIQIPPGVTEMAYFIFCRKASGTLWVDDVSLTREQ
ncbi:MAG TPA: hypothetical protein VNW30_06610 [Opitutaceae bacterium]|jgi:hypothetical protein|nr:hypothetical protein [Opitutaceae bacterium]